MDSGLRRNDQGPPAPIGRPEPAQGPAEAPYSPNSDHLCNATSPLTRPKANIQTNTMPHTSLTPKPPPQWSLSSCQQPTVGRSPAD